MITSLTAFEIFCGPLELLDNKNKILISTINAHSFNVLQSDKEFFLALKKSEILLPDGISIIAAMKLLKGKKIRKIAGEDLFKYELNRVNNIKGKCFFLGSSTNTLSLIEELLKVEYPNIIVETYSPPYKKEFSQEENNEMIRIINDFEPDSLFIGMTAPKQEKWAANNYERLKVGHICCIGAVFDFYAGVVRRAPKLWIKLGLEWLYRLLKEPRRLWRRYLIGNWKFIYYVLLDLVSLKLINVGK